MDVLWRFLGGFCAVLGGFVRFWAVFESFFNEFCYFSDFYPNLAHPWRPMDVGLNEGGGPGLGAWVGEGEGQGRRGKCNMDSNKRQMVKANGRFPIDIEM